MGIWPFKHRDEKGRFKKKPAGYIPEEGTVEAGDVDLAVREYGLDETWEAGPSGRVKVTVEDVERLIEGAGTDNDDPVDAEFRALGDSTSRNASPAAIPVQVDDADDDASEASRVQGPARRSGDRGAAAMELKLAKAQAKAKLAQAEKEILATKKIKREMGAARRKEAFDMAGRISKAFAPKTKMSASELYLGKASKSLYVPAKPSAEPLRQNAAGEMHQPRLERLRRAGSPGTGTTAPIARTVIPSTRLAREPSTAIAQKPEYGFLRQLALPSGTSRLEQLVFAEIVDNHDRDTMSHIKTEVGKLGYRASDVGGAVKSLVQKGFVEKTVDVPGEEPVFEVRS